MKNVFVVIPTLDPDEKVFLPFISKLVSEFPNVIIVDDGSKKKYKKVFDKVDKRCVLLKHFINLGKGRALKTAINYILNNYEHVDAIVTVEKTETKQRIFEKQLENEKGTHTISYSEAAREAYKSITPIIKTIIKEQMSQ